LRETKANKILALSHYGKFLGYCDMSFVIKEKGKEKKIPFYTVGEIVLQSGNSVSVGALASAGFWGVDVCIMTASGKPVSVMVALDDYSHVETRLAQYEAFKSERRIDIARKFVSGKIEGQRLLLEKYGLGFNEIPDLEGLSSVADLNVVEGHTSYVYFRKLVGLFPSFLRVKNRKGYRAFDPLNNLLNFGYEFLRWKIFRFLVKAKLEPFLGFLHEVKRNRPSLVCDFMELYRFLIDDFLVGFSQNLRRKDFEKYFEQTRYNRKFPRVFLSHKLTNLLVEELTDFFDCKVEASTIRNRGQRQKLNTLLSQEASLFAKCLRDNSVWIPRVVIP